MKKEYNKPTVEIMEIEGNNVICGTCAEAGRTTVVNNNRIKNILIDYLDYDGDGELSREEFNKGFGEGDGCNPVIDLYCKFTSNSDKAIAWS